MSHQFKMSSKHVFYKLSIMHLYFFTVTSHRIPKMKEFEIIEVDTHKLKFKIKKIKQMTP